MAGEERPLYPQSLDETESMTSEAKGALGRGLASELSGSGVITSPLIANAFSEVPRHLFVRRFYDCIDGMDWIERPVDARTIDAVYQNVPLVTKPGDRGSRLARSSTSKPGVMAEMLDALDLAPGMRALEIGTGTGYNAAILAAIVGDASLVTTIDIDPDVVAEAKDSLHKAGYSDVVALTGDGAKGCPARAPFDRVIVTAGCRDVAPEWITQLSPGGRILLPLMHGGWHPLMEVSSDGGRVRGRVVGWSDFIPMSGDLDAMRHGWGWPDIKVDEGPEQSFPFPSDQGPLLVEPWPGVNQVRDLHYFIALEDERACMSVDGLGVYDPERGLAIFDPNGYSVNVVGDATLFDEMLAFRESWNRYGKPSAGDFVSSFATSGGNSRATGPGVWTIRRKFHLQTVRLPKR